jgi:hypothetical protein
MQGEGLAHLSKTSGQVDKGTINIGCSISVDGGETGWFRNTIKLVLGYARCCTQRMLKEVRHQLEMLPARLNLKQRAAI